MMIPMNTVLLFVGGVAVCLTLISIFGPTMYMVENQHAAVLQNQPQSIGLRPKKQQQRQDHDARRIASVPAVVEVSDLEHESMFRAMIRSCIPTAAAAAASAAEAAAKKADKCKQFVPDWIDPPPPPSANDAAKSTTTTKRKTKTKKVQRIAVLAPPGEAMVETLLQRADYLVHSAKNGHKEEEESPSEDEAQATSIEVIPTTHVPPYGYGKTHGYTKILRIVPQPLLLQVTSALQAMAAELGKDTTGITLEDLQTATRQVMRFHCRLNHVAAHTAMLSMNFMDWLLDPVEAVGQLESFLIDEGSEQDRKQQRIGVVATMDDAVYAQGMMDNDDQGGSYMEQESDASRLLTRLQKELILKTAPTSQEDKRMTSNIKSILDRVVLDEIRLTKNMTAWPCPSFWTAAAGGAAAAEPESAAAAGTQLFLSPVTRKLAEALSPICDPTKDPYSSCFVPRDLCEAKGDGPCVKKKKKK